MNRLLNSSNTLLSTTSDMLNNGSVPFERVMIMINESATSQLIPTFLYLGYWISANVQQINNPEWTDKLYQALHVLEKISLRILPIILLNESYDYSWSSYQSLWILRDIYGGINDRIIQLRTTTKPLLFNSTSQPYYKAIFESMNSGKALNIESDAADQNSFVKFIKRMLINHAPIERFRKVADKNVLRQVLTQAIMEVIDDLNNAKVASEEQLCFAFSSIFLYIHAFALANEIDGQKICQFLQTRPYISPFCVLAMVNHIPSNLYLFNLLTPTEVIQNIEIQVPIIPAQYNIQNFGKPAKSSISSFLEKVPIILSNYFLCSTMESVQDTDKKTDNDFFMFIHLSTTSMYNKMKGVLSVARDRPLGSFHVSSIGILLLRCITFSLQRTLLDCAETKMFTPNFCYFVKTVFSSMSPAFADSVAPKFFDVNEKNSAIVNFTLRGLFYHILPTIVQHDTYDTLQKFIFNAISQQDTQVAARITLGKLLVCDGPKLTPVLMEEASKLDDIFVLLDYIDALSMQQDSDTCSEFFAVMENRQRLIERSQIIHQTTSGILTVEAFRPLPEFNSQSVSFLQKVERFSAENAAKDIHFLFDSAGGSYPIIRAISMMAVMRNADVAKTVVDYVCNLLRTSNSTVDQTHFDLRPCDHGMIIAQGLIPRLLVFQMQPLAHQLMEEMMPIFNNDKITVHWIHRFSVRFRDFLTPELKQNLLEVLSRQECAKKYFFPVDDPLPQITSKLVTLSNHLLHSPKVINHEYNSPYLHCQIYAVCQLVLSNKTDQELAEYLARPIISLREYWPHRESSSLEIARIAAMLNSSAAAAFFRLLIDKGPSKLSIKSGRLFMMETRISVFVHVCRSASKIIRKTPERLDLFIRLVLPSYHRLRGNPDAARAMLIGLMESVDANSSRVWQERVIDIVSLVYVRLDLASRPDVRADLKKAVELFAPDLKDIVLSCLDA